jgi:hypothetical protein
MGVKKNHEAILNEGLLDVKASYTQLSDSSLSSPVHNNVKMGNLISMPSMDIQDCMFCS